MAVALPHLLYNPGRLPTYRLDRFPWYCGKCAKPASCKTCMDALQAFRSAAAYRAQETRRKNDPDYFRPADADRGWQAHCHATVSSAVRRGILPDLRADSIACVDCGSRATVYEHRDYSRPLDVEPVCVSCNRRRGTAAWPTADRFKFKRVGEG